MTTREIVEKMLLNGKHINKFDLLSMANSVCLAQRIQEIRNNGWDVKSKTVKGKGTLVEYWLDESEIERITGTKKTDELSVKEEKKASQIAYDQGTLGLFGERTW